jgi:hypothetical protein
VSDSNEVLTSSTRGWTTCLREKASSCCVNAAARRGRLTDLQQFFTMFAGQLRRPLQQFDIRAYDRQQIVEVVRHTTGQRADGLHFLGVMQLRFAHDQRRLRLAAIGHVVKEDRDAVPRQVITRTSNQRLSDATYPLGTGRESANSPPERMRWQSLCARERGIAPRPTGR